MKTKSKQLDWYNNELTKDQIELNKEKNDFISQIKSLKKEDIIKYKIENVGKSLMKIKNTTNTAAD